MEMTFSKDLVEVLVTDARVLTSGADDLESLALVEGERAGIVGADHGHDLAEPTFARQPKGLSGEGLTDTVAMTLQMDKGGDVCHMLHCRLSDDRLNALKTQDLSRGVHSKQEHSTFRKVTDEGLLFVKRNRAVDDCVATGFDDGVQAPRDCCSILFTRRTYREFHAELQ